MPWTRLTTLLLAAAGAFHLHRAWSLAVTTDEAFTALSFAAPPWLDILTTYDANHHILHSLLCKLSLTLFGWNALALRLPSLLACLLWFTVARRLARRLFPDSPLQLVLCAWLVLHPALYDWFSLARGYSLALAFLLAAVHELAGPLPTLTRGSLLLGLSAASNFVFAIPAAAVALAWIAVRKSWSRMPDLAVPGAALAFIITAIPLSRAVGSNFYYGAPNLLESLRSLFGIPHQDFISYVLIAAVPITLAAALAFSRRDETLRFFVFSLTLCLLAAAALRLAGVPFPYGRTGTYITLLWILSALALAAHLSSISRLAFEEITNKNLNNNVIEHNISTKLRKLVRNLFSNRLFSLRVAARSVSPSGSAMTSSGCDKSSINSLVQDNVSSCALMDGRCWIWAGLLAPAALFAFSIPTGFTRPWQYDAGNHAVMDHILGSSVPDPTIAASPMLVPGLEFYRRRPASALWPAIRPFDPTASPAPTYLILRTDEPSALPPAAYTPIWRDFTSGIILYRR